MFLIGTDQPGRVSPVKVDTLPDRWDFGFATCCVVHVWSTDNDIVRWNGYTSSELDSPFCGCVWFPTFRCTGAVPARRAGRSSWAIFLYWALNSAQTKDCIWDRMEEMKRRSHIGCRERSWHLKYVCYLLGHGIEQSLERIVEPSCNSGRPRLHGNESAVTPVEYFARFVNFL